MQRFDPSCGLSPEEIRGIKLQVKIKCDLQLPLLPDPVETQLFMQGRKAWMYRWYLRNKEHPLSTKKPILLEVVVKLKKEFHEYLETTRYHFMCKVKINPDDLYNPKVSIQAVTP